MSCVPATNRLSHISDMWVTCEHCIHSEIRIKHKPTKLTPAMIESSKRPLLCTALINWIWRCRYIWTFANMWEPYKVKSLIKLGKEVLADISSYNNASRKFYFIRTNFGYIRVLKFDLLIMHFLSLTKDISSIHGERSICTQDGRR